MHKNTCTNTHIHKHKAGDHVIVGMRDTSNKKSIPILDVLDT